MHTVNACLCCAHARAGNCVEYTLTRVLALTSALFSSLSDPVYNAYKAISIAGEYAQDIALEENALWKRFTRNYVDGCGGGETGEQHVATREHGNVAGGERR